jgi:NAD(P)-dependent dehydrogenase (short-subunit alcohol dehydrogenase family)
MPAAGGRRLVIISMNEQTMTRAGFVPYGPSGAGVEALGRLMAADLADTPVVVNILLPGGATDPGSTYRRDRVQPLTTGDENHVVLQWPGLLEENRRTLFANDWRPTCRST